MLRNTEWSYGSLAKFFHWTIALLVLALILVGFFWQSTGTAKYTLINIHKLTGLLTAMIMLLRIGWTLHNPKPRLPNANRTREILLHAVHGFIYLALLLMPISGWIMSTASGHIPNLAGFALPMPGIAENKALAKAAGNIHYYLAWILIILISLHILAALKRHFIYKDNVLTRMLPGSFKRY